MEQLQHHFNIDPATYTYKDLLQYSKLTKDKDSTHTLKDLAEHLNIEDSWLRKRLFTIKSDLKKKRGIEKEDYLKTVLKCEKAETPSTSTQTQSDKLEKLISKTTEETLKEKVEQLKEELIQCHGDKKKTIDELESKHSKTVDDLQSSLTCSKQDRKKLKDSNSKLQKSNDALKDRLQKKAVCVKSLQIRQKILNRSLSRKSFRILKSKKTETDLRKNVVNLKKKLDSLNKKCLKQQKEREEIEESLKTAIEKMEHDGAKFKKENEELKLSLTYTENLLQDESSTVIKTRDGDRYTTNTRECIMNLLSEGVGVHHVNKVLESVSKLCGKTLSELPSISSINRIGDERASVAYMQIQDQLQEQSNTTLQSDETRKHGDVYEVYAVRDKDKKEWILGLKDMKDKSSDTCLDTLKSVIEDISSCTSTECGKKILINIKNTMSDRAATEKKFHELLKGYREELLPAIYTNWEQLSVEERESISTMNNFYCGLHLLVNFAEVSDSLVKEFESHVKDRDFLGAEAQPETKQFTEKDESGTVRLVRTACKCLSRGGDDKSGCYLNFKTFLRMKYKEKNTKVSHLLVPFRGNRFNILFYNAEVVFFLADDIKEFFEKVHKPANRLQKAVSYDICVELYLAVLKALGLCSKLITAPFWRAMEDNQCTIEKASEVYQKMFAFLEHAKEDSSDVITGASPLPELVKKDAVYSRLTYADEFDPKTIVVLQQIFGSWSALLSKAACDYLTGGKYSQVDDSLSEETSSTPTHNKFPERVFALLDALTRYRPIASTLCNEAYIMFSLNKTADWLASLDQKDKDELLIKARGEGRELRKKYLKRVKAIEEAQREALKAKRELLENKERERLRMKEQLVNDMLYYGLWQYPETVDQHLKGLPTESEKKKALKTQLQFRKVVLEQKADKKLFQLSEQGKQHKVEKLTENVKALIKASLSIPTSSQGNIFVGRQVVHYQMVDDIRTPFKGRVISNVPGYPEWSNVVYEGDDAVYAYKLADDYNSGDLEILVEGIGRDVCKRLVELGAKTYALSRTQEDLDSLKQEVPEIEVVQCDLGDWDQTREKVKGLGAIDLLVNNAGVQRTESFLEVRKESLDWIININFKALFNVSQVVARGMVDRGKDGSIVNVSSIASTKGLMNHSVYGSSKAAVDQLTRLMAFELGQHKIRVNAVNPTVALTDMGRKDWSDPVKANPLLSRIPMGRFLEVHEIVDTIMYLLSDKASMIHGVTMPIEGGLSTS